MDSRIFLAALTTAGILLASAGGARTEEFPGSPVRIISDSAPGSSIDVTMRLLADQLQKIWGKQVLVVNEPGASGAIAAREAGSASPDGYTLFTPAASVFLALKGAPGVPENLPLALPRDFIPIGFVTRQPMFIGASHKLGVKTIAELVALAKKEPYKVSYATTGPGRITDLTMRLLQQRADVKMQIVAYSGGPSAAMPDIVGGRVGVVLEGYAGLASAMSSNQIKSLAVAAPKRLADFPDLPTVAETYPGFQAGGWTILVAPKGTPQPIIDKISADLKKALEDKEMDAKMAKLGAYVQPMTPKEVLAFTQSEQETWRPILEKIAREAH
jgi:tripartite-type tricarboxylate transporter receptor subunit TctC